MFANTRVGQWNRGRAIQNQNARSVQSLSRMRATAIQQNKNALSEAQFRESHRQYLLRHSNEHPDESVEDMNIRLAADCQRRARMNAEFDRERSRSRSRERSRKSSQAARNILGQGYEFEDDDDVPGNTPPPSDSESEGDDEPTVESLLDILNRKQVQIETLLLEKAVLPLVPPVQPSQVIRIVQMSEGRCGLLYLK